MTLADQIYLEQIVGQTVQLRFHRQKILQVKYFESLDKWIIATDKNMYAYNEDEIKEQVKELKSLNWVPSYYTIPRDKAKKKADIIADVILGKAQLSATSFSPIKLEKIKQLILELP